MEHSIVFFEYEIYRYRPPQYIARAPEKEAVKALRKVGLLNHAERKIAGYSAGMKIRLGLAKAIVGKPELVVLDEPTANLDPTGRMQLLKLIKRMHKEEDIGFLISSHVLPELQKACSWVCLMYEGKAIEQDYVENLLEMYSSMVYALKVTKPDELATALRGLGLRVKVKNNTLYVRGDASTICCDVSRLISRTECELISFHRLGRSLENVFVKALERKKYGY